MLSVFTLTGCGLTLDEVLAEDGAVATIDASAPDAGSGAADGGRPRDAGASSMDASLPGDDAGIPDAAAFDARCSDLDDDGVTDCAGDCDDSDPTVHPGAPLICGDEVNNGCEGDAEESACLGLGTYVAPRGSNTNPGTRELPLQSVAQGLSNASRIGGGVDVYVAEGHYSEDVTMVESHSILCGYESGSWTRDPETFVTELASGRVQGVTFPSGLTNLTVLEGCRILGRSGVGESSAVTFSLGASGVLRENTIVAPDNDSGVSVGVAVYPAGAGDGAPNNPGTPVIEGNTVQLGRSRGGWSATSTSVGIVSTRTLIVVDGNDLTFADNRSIQRAIEVRNGLPGSIVVANLVRPGSGRAEHAYGLRVLSGSVEVTQNDIYAGASDGWAVGVEIAGNLGRVSVTNNQLFGGESETNLSAALLFSGEGVPSTAPDVLVHSNLIIGGAVGQPAAGIAWFGETMTPFAVGRIMNNIVHAGGGPLGYAMWERSTTLDPERLEGNALWAPLSTGGSIRAALYYDEGSSGLARISAVNALTEHAGVDSVAYDCAVLDPRPGGDPHLSSTSACIDIGTTSEAPPIDWDGEVRPRGRGTDIGVDEAR